jgi:hypothetical protein
VMDVSHFERQSMDDEVYSAYCITPFFPSCEGSGTSRLGLPVTLIDGFPDALCAVTALAGFEEDDEIAAIDR